MEQERFFFLRILLRELVFAGLDVAIHCFQETKPLEACGGMWYIGQIKTLNTTSVP